MVAVTEATIRKASFNNLYDLINNNKPSGWTVLSSYPESSPVFPCIVVNQIKPKVISEGMRIEHRLRTFDIDIDFYVEASSRKEAIDEAMDSVEQTILNGQATLVTANIILYGEEPIDQIGMETININKYKLHTGTMMITLRLL
jgi:hypothetical protein